MPSPTTILAVLWFALGACSADTAEPRPDAPSADGAILTSFDRLTLAHGDETTFRATVVGPAARLNSAGLVFASRAPAIARVMADRGQARVTGIASGRTFVLVRSAAGADSVEVVVQ
jgi:hypothetical protein